MTAVRRAARQTFQALQVRNFRLYFIGQVISVSGTWMQSVALALLVLSDRLHGTGVDVGLVTALQFLPMLLFGSFGGLIADRVDKRRLLFVTQGAAGVLALALGPAHRPRARSPVGGLPAGHPARRGQPVRQPGPPDLRLRDGGPRADAQRHQPEQRAHELGPGHRPGHRRRPHLHRRLRRLLPRQRGLLPRRDRRPVPDAAGRAAPATRGGAGPRARSARACATCGPRPALRDPLLAMAVVGIFAFNFTTTLPLFAKFTFHGGAGTYSAFTVAMGCGAVVGGLLVAHRSRPSTALLEPDRAGLRGR